MNYGSDMNCTVATSPVPTKGPREDSICGAIKQQTEMLFECRRIAEDILYVLTGGPGMEPQKDPENLMQQACSNLEITKMVIGELAQIKDLICG